METYRLVGWEIVGEWPVSATVSATCSLYTTRSHKQHRLDWNSNSNSLQIGTKRPERMPHQLNFNTKIVIVPNRAYYCCRTCTEIAVGPTHAVHPAPFLQLWSYKKLSYRYQSARKMRTHSNNRKFLTVVARLRAQCVIPSTTAINVTERELFTADKTYRTSVAAVANCTEVVFHWG